MLSSIKNVLNIMGEALTAQDAGEMLTKEQKAEVLARYKNHHSNSAAETVSRGAVSTDDGAIAAQGSGVRCYTTN